MAVTQIERPSFTKPNGNGSASPAEVIEQAVLPPTFWQRHFKWERNLTVAGRTLDKGFVISPQIAGILLAAFLAVLGWAYKSTAADQRETLVAITEMKTMLNERTRQFERQQDKAEAELKDERAVAKLQRDNLNDKLLRMQYALKQKGIVISE